MIVRSRAKNQDILEPGLLLAAYTGGYFPMADPRDSSIGWFSPDPRAVIPLDGLKISRSLGQVIKKKVYDVRVDTAFEEVIRECSRRPSTWISEQIIRSYMVLFDRGSAHSVEAWCGNDLAGGLYGVAVGAAFFGESMFSRMRDASKVCLAALVRRLRSNGFTLLDTQFITPHLARLGAVEIPRTEYLRLLESAVTKQASFQE